MQSAAIEYVHISIVSANALKIWSAKERAIEIDGSKDIRLKGVHLKGVTAKGEAYDPATAPFWPAALRKSGYQTALIGSKWHIGHYY